MKKAILYSLLFFGFLNSSKATHIVGGELELTYIAASFYQLSLYIYFDEVNGNPGAKDPSATVFVFRKSDGNLMATHQLDFLTDVLVSYTNVDCQSSSLRTSRLVYGTEIELDPAVYNDPEGYYATYQRCCRNNFISNIQFPEATGQAFYVEFPPVLKEGQLFINSTPQLFPPLGDYACLNKPFYFDFAGSDLDGDSLSYSLSVPLAGYSSQTDPGPDFGIPAPYDEVTFREGYSLENMIAGNPPLAITPKGFITITPTELGLFVFAVKCEEYRDGIKIGEVRRDYQMLVIDCPTADPPVIEEVTDQGGNAVDPSMTIEFDINSKDDCLLVSVSDPNPTSFATEIRPVSFTNPNLISISEPPSGVVAAGESVTFEVCVNSCVAHENKAVYDFLLLISDQSCAKPLYDTIPMSFQVTDTNNPPVFRSVSLPFSESLNAYEATLTANSPFSIFMPSRDENPENLDSLIVEISSPDFPVAELNATIINGNGRDSLNTTVVVSPNCSLPSLIAEKGGGPLLATFSVKEVRCPTDFVARASFDVLFAIETDGDNLPPKFSRNTLYRGGNDEQPLRKIAEKTIEVGQTFIYDISAIDDFATDSVQLFANPVNGASLLPVGTYGFSSEKNRQLAEGRFVLTANCQMLGDSFSPKTYQFDFVALDDPIKSPSCGGPLTDTLTLLLTVQDVEQTKLAPFPNVFTPDGNGLNDTYRIPNLPLDDCQDEFVGFQLFNRWGDEVFRAEDRDFEWPGHGYPAGVYFYIVSYRNKSYKGQLHLLGNQP